MSPSETLITGPSVYVIFLCTASLSDVGSTLAASKMIMNVFWSIGSDIVCFRLAIPVAETCLTSSSLLNINVMFPPGDVLISHSISSSIMADVARLSADLINIMSRSL